MLLDAKADLLVYGNGERQIVEIAHRLAGGERVEEISDVRGTAFVRPARAAGWIEIDSTTLDTPGPVEPKADPYRIEPGAGDGQGAVPPIEGGVKIVRFARRVRNEDRARSVVRLPLFEQVRDDPVLYAHASRILHLEANPGNARALVQRHGRRGPVAESAPVAAVHGGDGRGLRAAVCRDRTRPTAQRPSRRTR